MENKSKLKKLQNELLKKGVSGYEDLENTLIEVFKKNFGIDNVFYKDAERIKSGENVPCRFGYINGLVPESEYKQNQYNKYMKLIAEALNYLSYSTLEDESVNTVAENNKIFIVHGHDETTKLKISNYMWEIGLRPIILHDQPNGGISSLIQKFQENSDVTCAIILFTSDDVGKSKEETDTKPRARQNVVFEAGYFIGKLGSNRVVMIKDPDVEIVGDLNGCVYIENDKSDGWKEHLKKELKRMGIPYSE